MAGFVSGEFPAGATEGTAGTSTLGILALGVLGLFLLWDLFTIPRPIAVREEGTKQELLAQLGATNQDVTRLAANKDATTPRTVWIATLLVGPALISVSILFFLLQGRPRYTTEEEKRVVDMPPGPKNAELEKK